MNPVERQAGDGDVAGATGASLRRQTGNDSDRGAAGSPNPISVEVLCHFLVNTITQSRTTGGTGGCHFPWSSALIWPRSVSLPVEALNRKPWSTTLDSRFASLGKFQLAGA